MRIMRRKGLIPNGNYHFEPRDIRDRSSRIRRVEVPADSRNFYGTRDKGYAKVFLLDSLNNWIQQTGFDSRAEVIPGTGFLGMRRQFKVTVTRDVPDSTNEEHGYVRQVVMQEQVVRRLTARRATRTAESYLNDHPEHFPGLRDYGRRR